MEFTMRILFTLLFMALFAGSVGAQQTDDCIECHGAGGFSRTAPDGSTLSLFVDLEGFRKSVHGDLDCVDCHDGIDALPHAGDLARVDCAACHDEAEAAYSMSVHSRAPVAGRPAPARCADCHGTHEILYCDDPLSRVRPAHIEKVCGACHARPDVIGLFGGRDSDAEFRDSQNPLVQYGRSVHARSLRDDPAGGAATCTSCHGFHGVFRKIDLRSKYCDPNIPETCGACHEAQRAEYKKSTHWHSVQRGHYESPVCNDCHGGHAIASIADLESRADGRDRLSELCRGCHASEVLMGRFGLDAERFESYAKTYHALAARHGSAEAAACTSCHETHAIRAHDDPASSIHPARVAATCARCHEGATERFARIPIHPFDQAERNPAAFWIRKIYIVAIVIVIALMFVHNGVILLFFIRRKYQAEKKAPAVRRFQRFEVYQHGLLIVSFVLLVVTGFALKFPDTFWVRWLSAIGLTESVRSSIHRAAAVGLVASALLQTVYLAGTRRGWRELRALCPTFADLRHLFQNMKFHLALSGRKPAFGRFDYTEKIEYLALIWGVAVMAATGFVLWFPEFFARFLPWWAFEAAEIIHFFEAILALLALLFWHFFFVIYHPESYPMKLTWLHGKITEAEEIAEAEAENK